MGWQRSPLDRREKGVQMSEMSPADKYREDLAGAIYIMYYMNECDTWQYIVACEEQDRVGWFIPKEII